MFSPHELNTIMRLDWPKQRIVRMAPYRILNMMTLNEFDKKNITCLSIKDEPF